MQNFKSDFSKKNLKAIINFGKMPLANGFIARSDKKKEYQYNLKLGFNPKLKLVQLFDYPDPKKMFNKNYAFLSSTSESMKTHFVNYAKKLKKKIGKKNFSVLEIGCNDGILLKNFKKNHHLGVEPSQNVCRIAQKKGLNVINKFFNEDLLKTKNINKEFDIICGANVFCHIPNLYEMFFTLSKFLKKGGIIAIEEPYLGDMITKTSYDQVYDEHIYIFSIISINKVASLFGLEVFDAEHQVTHGGSMRYYLSQKKERRITSKLKSLLKGEKKLGLDNFIKLKKFEKKCKKSRENFANKIKKFSKNFEIYGYGATSKSTTILNFCKIGKKYIKAIFDNSFTKIGKFTPITHIPILNYEKNFERIKPKICILFAWNHYEEICKKEKDNLKKGMRFISHIDKRFLLKSKKYFI
jgi:methylation protein EvaC